jgi:hypothetical protein
MKINFCLVWASRPRAVGVRVIIARRSPPNRFVPNRSLRSLPIRIYRVQTDGALQFVEANQTFDGARERVRELGKHWPGDYVIENEGTGERVFVSTRDERKN